MHTSQVLRTWYERCEHTLVGRDQGRELDLQSVEICQFASDSRCVLLDIVIRAERKPPSTGGSDPSAMPCLRFPHPFLDHAD